MTAYIGPAPVPQAVQRRETFSATAGQTSFATAGYQPGYILVFLNGVMLPAEDYTATNGSDVVLATGAADGDTLETVAFTPFQAVDQAFTGDTSVENLDVTGDLSASNFVGAVMAFAMSTPPSGWLECDGSAVSRSTYANLFSAIGTNFGSGDGSTTFNLPDLRGEFVRGWDNGKGTDSGRSFGSNQSDEFKDHNHSIFRVDRNQAGGTTNRFQFNETVTGKPLNLASTVNSGGNETRPRNIALMYCIKH